MHSHRSSENTCEWLSRNCLLVNDELAGSRFGFIDKVNQVGRLEVIAISDPALGYLSGARYEQVGRLSIYYRFYRCSPCLNLSGSVFWHILAR
jgi:hypothetical protein